MFFAKAIPEAKEDIIVALRICFSYDEDFNYNILDPTGQNSFLKIIDGWPEQNFASTAIYITDSDMKWQPFAIGEEVRDDTISIGNTPGRLHGGRVDVKLTLTCTASTTVGRNDLASRTSTYLWWMSRNFLYEAGWVMESANVGSEIEEADRLGGRPLFKQNVEVHMWSEWGEFVSADIVQGIRIDQEQIMDIRREFDVTTLEAMDLWAEKLRQKHNPS